MPELQAWFAPLLWVFGTLASIVAFVRLCKPVWNLLQTPKQLTATIIALDTKMTAHFTDIDTRLDGFEEDLRLLKEFDEGADDVQINMMRDRLSQGHRFFMGKGSIDDHSYRTLCDLYAAYERRGGNSYAHTIMDALHDLYKNPRSAPTT